MWVFDLEGDGLKPTKLHCLVTYNFKTKVWWETTDPKMMTKFFEQADFLICHNAIRFDKRVVKDLLGVDIKARMIDTLAMSWILYPGRNKHGLESWGEDLGVPKPVVKDWKNLTIEEYLHRCREDVKINVLLWNKIYRYLIDLYGTEKKAYEYTDYITFKMECAALQESSGWKVNVPYATQCLKEMSALRDAKVVELRDAMPLVPVISERWKPKRFFNKDGDYTKLALDWINLCLEHNHELDSEESIRVTKGYEIGNRSSPDPIKKWLYSLGWVPQTFEYKKNSLGEMRAIPQINLKNGKGICPSIKMLYPIEPRLEVLDGLSILNHRIPLLQGIVNSVDEHGYTRAEVQGLTNTLRFQHATVVNLPKADREYGEYIRGSLIASEGKILCGSDMSSLEDRLKQHFIYPLDPDYVNTMLQDDFDPHITIAVMAGMLTQEQADQYKQGDKRWKPVRDIAKNGNYASTENSGHVKLCEFRGSP